MTFASHLKSARLAAGLSQTAMSAATGIPVRTIQDWEAGKRIPPEWAQRYILADLENMVIHKG